MKSFTYKKVLLLLVIVQVVLIGLNYNTTFTTVSPTEFSILITDTLFIKWWVIFIPVWVVLAIIIFFITILSNLKM